MPKQYCKNKTVTGLKLIGMLLLGMITAGWVADNKDAKYTYKEITVEQLATANNKRKKPYER